jgi:PAS domain S-box-containing protein
MVDSYSLLKLFLFVEAGFTAFLVMVLIATRPYFRSQSFFWRWMWAWTAHAANLAVTLSLTCLNWGGPLLRSVALLISVILGLLYIPLLIAGVEAFRNSGRDARCARCGTIAALASALAIYLASTLAGSNTSLALQIRTLPREIAAAAALWYCAWVFFRYRRRTASNGSLLAMLSCGGYGLGRLLYALLPAGGSALGLRWMAIDLLCQGGIAIATLLLLLEHEAQADSAVRTSEQRYQLLFERNLAGVFRSRLDGTLVDCNEALCNLFGYGSREEFQRLNTRFLYVDPQERHTIQTALLGGAQVVNQEVRFHRKDGSEMVALVTVTLVAGPAADEALSPGSGQAVCPAGVEPNLELQGTVLDISEVRRLREHLFQAQKMEAINRFAGGVAHDFNNLLTVVTAYCELLSQEVEDPVQRKHAAEALEACWQGAELIKQLLIFSRRQPIAQQMLDLSAVVREMSGMLRRLLNENIELHFDLKEDLGRCKGDATHMRQILMNLAANARDAMPRGGRLRIQTSDAVVDPEQAARLAPMPAGDYVALTFSDSGTGIDPALQGRIFEPFFTTKELGKGTGLGLSSVYGIVKQNNGFIFLESELGAGATFTIYLPRVPYAVADGTPSLKSFRADGIAPTSTSIQ